MDGHVSFPHCRFLPTDPIAHALYPDNCCGFNYPRSHQLTIMTATSGRSDFSERIVRGGILPDRQDAWALPDHRERPGLAAIQSRLIFPMRSLQVQMIFAASSGPRIHRALGTVQVCVSRRRVERLMRAAGLRARIVLVSALACRGSCEG
jgi:hypothetical protein